MFEKGDFRSTAYRNTPKKGEFRSTHASKREKFTKFLPFCYVLYVNMCNTHMNCGVVIMDKQVFEALSIRYAPIITSIINKNVKFFRFHKTIKCPYSAFCFISSYAIEKYFGCCG